MYKLSQRCKKLADDAVNIKSISDRVSVQRAYWYKWGQINYSGDDCSNIELAAAGVASVMRNSTPVIGDDELIVGYNYGVNEYCSDRESFRKNGFTDEQTAWFFDENIKNNRYKYKVPAENYTDKERALLAEYAAGNTTERSNKTENHSVIGYEKVIRHGFEGLLRDVNKYAQINGESGYYKAVRMICEAGCVYGENYAFEAERLNLTEIAEVCRQVPRKGARTFREAVQSLWFAHIVNTWEDYINANSLGRLDQILYPYYKNDIDNGTLTNEEAFEIICCLWIKLYRDYDVQQSCVGGRDIDGNSSVNELSYMMLEATEQLNFVRCLSVRFDSQTDKKFIERALKVAGTMQKGIPFFFNDDVIIPALTAAGIPEEDACGYTQIGCVETVIPGKSNPHAVNSRCNLLKAIEYTIGNGNSIINPKLSPGIETGDPLLMDTFNNFFEAVLIQIKHMIRSTANLTVMYMPSSEYNSPKPVKSLLTEGCTERGIDFNARGAKYDYYQVMLMGIPNLADSLAAVKELIYDKKIYTMSELIYQINHNWEDESMRLDFLNKAPKYGNDIEAVDKFAYKITDYACDCLAEESERTGCMFHAQPFTFLWMIDAGRLTAATPDGRRNGEIIAYSVSPMQGRDNQGLTSLLNSIAKLPSYKTPGITSAIVEVDLKLFSDEFIPYLADILKAASQKGLCNVQFNTVNAETLINAQKYPDKYQNLAVRVSGFSQKFNLLSKELQDHIIARTKHSEL